MKTLGELQKHETLVIAEVAQAHDGSLGLAHSFIDAIAAAGADAVKFQTHIAHAESSLAEPWRVKFSYQDATRYEYWKRMEFTEAQWRGLKRHAEECGLLFISSPFSMEAVELLTHVGVGAWKVASGELSNTAMFDCMAATRWPMLISTGMSPLEEIDAAVKRAHDAGAPLAVLQCTSAYPCPPEKLGLNLISYYRDRYGCPAGLSDHSGSLYAGLAAAALGAEVIEVHVTFDRRMFGPDSQVSLEFAELRQLIDGVRFIERARANPVDKDAMASELSPMRGLFTKSVFLRHPLPAGATLGEADLALRKPGTGIPAAQMADLVGKTLRCTVGPDRPLQISDVAEWSAA